MKLSVIVPVYNEERYIERCLESIGNQTRRPEEVIVVDDGSKDNSKFKIQSAKLRYKFIFLEQEHQGPAAARNLGASKASGEILVFLDADMVYDKDFLKEMVKPIETGKEVTTFTTSEYVGNLNNSWARFWDEVGFGNQGRRSDLTENQRGQVFRAIKAEVFERGGGYAASGYTDDASLLKKVNQTAKAVNKAVCYHFNPSNLREVFESSRWMGRDSKNKNYWLGLIVFSPIWSAVKAIIGLMKKRSWKYGVFRLVFDLGYWLGMVDGWTRGINYK